jgi:hypothetical protein
MQPTHPDFDGDLLRLLEPLHGHSTESLEQRGQRLYENLYLDNDRFGIRRTHDDQVLVFFRSQFDHAFFTTSDRLCHPDAKDIIRRGSLERIRWIGLVCQGLVPGSACFEVPSPTGRFRPPNRLYAVYSHPYVVWLEPRSKGGWKFSSAYPCSIEEIHRYSRNGRTVWKWKEPRD